MFPTKIAIILALVIASHGAAYLKGRYDMQATVITAELDQAKQDAAILEKLAATEEANRALSRALEDKAYAEPPSSNDFLPASRVMRLNQQ